jgi:hypothetical protein
MRQRRAALTSTSADIVQQVQPEGHHLLADATGPEAPGQTAYTVERTLFRGLATAERWDTAHVWLGETHPHRTAWGRSSLAPGRAGQLETVITALDAEAHAPACTAPHWRAVQCTIGSYRRHCPYMRYAEELAQGWPSGLGVIEGAGGQLVKDRLEPSGMRWTTAGAQAVLDRRAVRLNGQWERAGQVHRQPHHQRLDHSAMPVPAQAESHLLAWAA